MRFSLSPHWLGRKRLLDPRGPQGRGFPEQAATWDVEVVVLSRLGLNPSSGTLYEEDLG